MGSFLEDPPALTAAADFPELCVEWLPLGATFDSDGEWCDITPYVRVARPHRGTQYELDQAQAGTLDLELVVDPSVLDGRIFDKSNVDGPFYASLRPGRQVRVTATWDGVLYHRFRGYLVDVDDAVPDDKMMVTSFTAKDALVVLEQEALPESRYEALVAAKRPYHWWRLDEPAGAQRVFDSGTARNRYTGFVDHGLPTFGADPLLLSGPTSVTWGGAFVRVPGIGAGLGETDVIETWFQVDALPATSIDYPLFRAEERTSDPTYFFTFRIDLWGSSSGTPGQVSVRATDGANTNSVFSGTNLADGEVHHVVAYLGGSSGWEVGLYIDGVLIGTDSTNDLDALVGEVFDWISYRSFIGGTAYNVAPKALPGSQSHVVAHRYQLSAAEVAELYEAGIGGFDGLRTGEAAAAALDAIGWPETLRDIDTGASTLGPYDFDGGNALSFLQSLQNTELGRLDVTADGKVRFKSRHAPYLEATSTESQESFGDEHSAATLKYAARGFKLAADEALIRNPVTASRQGGVTVTVDDPTLFAKNGRRSWTSPPSLDGTDVAVAPRANWLLNRYKDRADRLASMLLLPRTDTDLWPAVLGLELGYRITVGRTPLGSGSESQVDQYVERIDETISPKVWETTLVGSPVDDTAYLIVGVGRVGVGRVGY